MCRYVNSLYNRSTVAVHITHTQQMIKPKQQSLGVFSSIYHFWQSDAKPVWLVLFTDCWMMMPLHTMWILLSIHVMLRSPKFFGINQFLYHIYSSVYHTYHSIMQLTFIMHWSYTDIFFFNVIGKWVPVGGWRVTVYPYFWRVCRKILISHKNG